MIQFSNKYLQLFDAGKLGKKELWGYLVHELEHARQNLQILSTPSLADKAIKTYSKNTAEIFLKYFKELPTEEIEKMIKENSTDKCVNILKKILETRKNGKEITKKLEEEAFKQFYKEAFTEWKNTQEIVKNFIEPILPNTKKEKISKKLFSEMVNIKSYNENNSFFENLKYVFQFSEMFAYFKQIYSIRNLNF
ncbi:MAG: hypothetical protein MJ180_01195 [Candidatus Gastranaerophilales bacterium]|nr:hypothetical protein [Candidatus Gastranaerophilales bacterium]